MYLGGSKFFCKKVINPFRLLAAFTSDRNAYLMISNNIHRESPNRVMKTNGVGIELGLHTVFGITLTPQVAHYSDRRKANDLGSRVRSKYDYFRFFTLKSICLYSVSTLKSPQSQMST